MRFVRLIIGAMLLMGAVAQGQTLRLMARAVVVDGVVRVGNIATIEDATPAVMERLAQTVVVEKIQASREVRAEDVLFAVLQQNRDLGLAGTLVVRGAATCTVTSEGKGVGIPVVMIGAGQPQAAEPTDGTHGRDADAIANAANGTVLANRPVDVTEAAVPVRVATASALPVPATGVDAPVPGSLGDLITQQVVKDFAANAGEISVDFVTADAAIKSVPAADEQWSIHSTMRPSLGTMQWEAKLMRGGKPARVLWVQALVKRRAVQVLAGVDIERGRIVTADMVHAQVVWLDRQMPDMPTDPAEMVGMQATRGMAAGTPLNRHDFKVADDVQPGDMVTVIFANPGLKMKVVGKALSGGRRGDAVTIQNGAEVVKATIFGRRLAEVGTMDTATEQKLRETP